MSIFAAEVERVWPGRGARFEVLFPLATTGPADERTGG